MLEVQRASLPQDPRKGYSKPTRLSKLRQRAQEALKTVILRVSETKTAKTPDVQPTQHVTLDIQTAPTTTDASDTMVKLQEGYEAVRSRFESLGLSIPRSVRMDGKTVKALITHPEEDGMKFAQLMLYDFCLNIGHTDLTPEEAAAFNQELEAAGLGGDSLPFMEGRDTPKERIRIIQSFARNYMSSGEKIDQMRATISKFATKLFANGKIRHMMIAQSTDPSLLARAYHRQALSEFSGMETEQRQTQFDKKALVIVRVMNGDNPEAVQTKKPRLLTKLKTWARQAFKLDQEADKYQVAQDTVHECRARIYSLEQKSAVGLRRTGSGTMTTHPLLISTKSREEEQELSPVRIKYDTLLNLVDKEISKQSPSSRKHKQLLKLRDELLFAQNGNFKLATERFKQCCALKAIQSDVKDVFQRTLDSLVQDMDNYAVSQRTLSQYERTLEESTRSMEESEKKVDHHANKMASIRPDSIKLVRLAILDYCATKEVPIEALGKGKHDSAIAHHFMELMNIPPKQRNGQALRQLKSYIRSQTKGLNKEGIGRLQQWYIALKPGSETMKLRDQQDTQQGRDGFARQWARSLIQNLGSDSKTTTSWHKVKGIKVTEYAASAQEAATFGLSLSGKAGKGKGHAITLSRAPSSPEGDKGAVTITISKSQIKEFQLIIGFLEGIATTSVAQRVENEKGISITFNADHEEEAALFLEGVLANTSTDDALLESDQQMTVRTKKTKTEKGFSLDLLSFSGVSLPTGSDELSLNLSVSGSHTTQHDHTYAANDAIQVHEHRTSKTGKLTFEAGTKEYEVEYNSEKTVRFERFDGNVVQGQLREVLKIDPKMDEKGLKKLLIHHLGKEGYKKLIADNPKLPALCLEAAKKEEGTIKLHLRFEMDQETKSQLTAATPKGAKAIAQNPHSYQLYQVSVHRETHKEMSRAESRKDIADPTYRTSIRQIDETTSLAHTNPLCDIGPVLYLDPLSQVQVV